MFHYCNNEQITSAMGELAMEVPIGVPTAGTKFLQETLDKSVCTLLDPGRPSHVSDEHYVLLTKLLVDTDFFVSSDDEISNNDSSLRQGEDSTVTDKASICQEVIFFTKKSFDV